MKPFGKNADIVREILSKREERGVSPSSDVSIAVLSIIAGMGYSKNRIDKTANQLRYAEAKDITDDEVLHEELINSGFEKRKALKIATNALRVTGHVNREPNEIERILEMDDGEEKEKLLKEAGLDIVTESGEFSNNR